ncbi:MAG: hypothetical protein MUF64_14905 [Polyangiaceae bacterium]|jgi:hypothetical protein|nr:hypothetical protein [Polyangiaceae bacterium]
MTRSRILLPLSTALAAAAMLASTEASAQQPPAPAAAASGGTNHAQVVGSFGVGYMGLGGIAIGQLQGGPTPDISSQNIDAPIIGARYWVSESLGIDAGIGFGNTSSKRTVKNGGVTTETEGPSATGFLFHAGVPLVLGTPGQYHTFQVVPELNVGFASSTIKGTTNNGVTTPDIELGGFRLDVGARVGSEIHFGFVGLPKLALQATVGLYFSTSSVSGKQDQLEVTRSQTSIGTSVQAAPWSIFTNNISALYYF